MNTDLEVAPLTAEEILALRGILKRRMWVIAGLWGSIGTALGGLIVAHLMGVM